MYSGGTKTAPRKIALSQPVPNVDKSGIYVPLIRFCIAVSGRSDILGLSSNPFPTDPCNTLMSALYSPIGPGDANVEGSGTA